MELPVEFKVTREQDIESIDSRRFSVQDEIRLQWTILSDTVPPNLGTRSQRSSLIGALDSRMQVGTRPSG